MEQWFNDHCVDIDESCVKCYQDVIISSKFKLVEQWFNDHCVDIDESCVYLSILSTNSIDVITLSWFNHLTASN